MATTLERLLRARELSRSGEGRRIREESNLSQRFVAGEIDVAHTTLAKWEQGDAPQRFSAGLLRWEAFLRRLESARAQAAAS